MKDDGPIMNAPAAPPVFCALDIETTGANPVFHEILEIALIKFTRDGVTDLFHSLVRPRRPIPHDSIVFHGITDDMVTDSPAISEITDEISGFLDGPVLVAHNPGFDLSFISRALGEERVPRISAIDTVRLARKAFPGLPNYKLATICGFLGLDMEYHRALPDAYGSMEILRKSLDVFQPDGAWLMRDLEKFHGAFYTVDRILRRIREHPVKGRMEFPPGKEISINYRNSKGKNSERKIIPYTVMRFGARDYLKAFCFLRNEVRLFRIDRISIVGQ